MYARPPVPDGSQAVLIESATRGNTIKLKDKNLEPRKDATRAESTDRYSGCAGEKKERKKAEASSSSLAT